MGGVHYFDVHSPKFMNSKDTRTDNNRRYFIDIDYVMFLNYKLLVYNCCIFAPIFINAKGVFCYD